MRNTRGNFTLFKNAGRAIIIESPLNEIGGQIATMSNNDEAEGYLTGQLLIAMPSMLDARFARTVIYMCVHSAEGAMGFHPSAHAGLL